jgi:hypothetical protein
VSGHVYIFVYVLGVSILFLSTNFLLDFLANSIVFHVIQVTTV